jgi:uracil-DNA glycosylase family 4
MILKEKKQKELAKITQEIKNCKECQKDKSGKAVPGEGNPGAKIVFVGEAPGATEAKTGRPFVGPSGKYLTGLLTSIGINRKEVYITSPVKYFPGRRAPTSKEIEHGRVHLLKQLKIIKPKIIVLLGNVAMQAVLGEKLKVFKNHGQVIKKDKTYYFLTFHPSAARRFTRVRLLMEKDFHKLQQLKKSIGIL